MDGTPIGARLRTLRRWRGMTQTELAGLAGLSPSFVSMLETGQRMLDRRSDVAALASALRVSETDLVGGPHLSEDRVRSDPHMSMPALRMALQTNSLSNSGVERARPLTDLAQVLTEQIDPLRRAGEYVSVGRLLPDVLDELHCHVAGPEDEAAYRLALETLIEACICGAIIAKHLNYTDLACLAAQRAAEAAVILDDPIQRGKADFVSLFTRPRAGSLERNMAAAEQAANALEPHARDRLGLSVLGILALMGSLAAASLRRRSAAVQWLTEAERLASRVPDEPSRNWQIFSATNVSMWRVMIAVENGEAGRGIRDIAGRISLDNWEGSLPRRAGYFIDVGRGLAREPQTRAEAVRWFRNAEAAAPQHTRNSAAARETVAYLLNRATAASVGRELRGLAARMGVPH